MAYTQYSRFEVISTVVVYLVFLGAVGKSFLIHYAPLVPTYWVQSLCRAVADLPFPFALCTAGIFYLTRQASAVTEQQKAALKEKGMYDCQLSLNFSV